MHLPDADRDEVHARERGALEDRLQHHPLLRLPRPVLIEDEVAEGIGDECPLSLVQNPCALTLGLNPFLGARSDGGSEHQAEFERECERRGILLFVLPSRSPKLNGHVGAALSHPPFGPKVGGRRCIPNLFPLIRPAT